MYRYNLFCLNIGCLIMVVKIKWDRRGLIMNFIIITAIMVRWVNLVFRGVTVSESGMMDLDYIVVRHCVYDQHCLRPVQKVLHSSCAETPRAVSALPPTVYEYKT